MSKPECIQSMIDLSLYHLPESKPDFGNLRTVKYAQGYLVFVSVGEILPEWLQPILVFAQKQNAMLICFDLHSADSPLFATYEEDGTRNPPTAMTPVRARYLLTNTTIGGDLRMAYVPKYKSPGAITHPDGITEAEEFFVKLVWDLIPSGSSSLSTALRQIAEGKV